MASVDDGHVDASFAGAAGGTKFRTHASGTEFPCALAKVFHGGRQFGHGAYELRRSATVRDVKAVDIGKQQEPVGLDGGREQRAEFVVVAEGADQFSDRDAVVLVDDGHNAKLYEFVQGILEILVSDGRREVVT